MSGPRTFSAPNRFSRWIGFGNRGVIAANDPEPSPYFRGIPALFCRRQNTGRPGLDDHYSPVS